MELLEKVVPFKATADDFSDSNPIFSYYFYKYYLTNAVGFYKDCTDNSQKSQLECQIKAVQKNLTKMRNAAGSDLNQQNNMKQILQYTELMFAKTDHFYRQGKVTKQIAEDFLTIFRLYEVVSKFSKIDQNQNKRRLYSKKKFIEIMKQVKSNPMNQSKPVQKQIQSQPPPPMPTNTIKMSVKQIDNQIMKSGFKPSLPKPSQLISYDKITMQIQASKCLQNAVSQLSFDRFKFARQQALRALQLLDSLCDN